MKAALQQDSFFVFITARNIFAHFTVILLAVFAMH